MDQRTHKVSISPPCFDSDEDRYTQEALLGEGAFGKVLLCHDQRIGRVVAMKVLRSELRDKEGAPARFVVEAQLQGQLEHPSIVPVYDLARSTPSEAPRSESASLAFTMKRVRGQTLKQVLAGLKEGDTETESRYSRRRLLSDFVRVCLAVDYAHSLGVIHRDLKPSNIMFGDFGEVYVLDWGIAKVMGDNSEQEQKQRVPTAEDFGPETATGERLGTLGYMSAEQLRGAPLSPGSDVYALGAILFEILTQEPLHNEKSRKAMIASALKGPEARPSRRAPEAFVAPELEQICVQAAAGDRTARYDSARKLSDALEEYLDGARDEQLRKKLAEKHAQEASESLSGAKRESGRGAMDHRRDAMKSVGRALALDPSNADALSTMVQLLSTPPKELPGEVADQVRRTRADQTRRTGGIAGIAYISHLLSLPLFLWSGIRDPLPLIIFLSLLVVSGLACFGVAKQKNPSPVYVFTVMVISTLCFVSTNTLFGPLVLTPGLVAVNTAAFSILLEGRLRVASIAFGCGGVALPPILELLELVPSSYRFASGAMTILPGPIELPMVPTVVLLTAGSVAAVVTSSLAISGVRDTLSRTEEKLSLHSWHIRQLLPEAAQEEE